MDTRPPLLIRADATHATGIGHVMRCLAVADSHRARGGEVTLAGDIADALRERIDACGARLAPWPASVPAQQDPATLISLAASMPMAPTVLLDGYEFTEAYLETLTAAGLATALFDDHMHLSRYAARLVINPNPGTETLRYNVDAGTRLLLGTRYAPVRREFTTAARNDTPPSGQERNVLILAGGSDPDELTLALALALRDVAPTVRLRFVLGPAYTGRARLEAVLAGGACPAELLADVHDMAGQMAWAHLAVSAGGSTCHELACMGVPFVVCPVADNQRHIATGYTEGGAAVLLAPTAAGFGSQLRETLACLMTDPRLLAGMSAAGRSMVDGKGPDRLEEAMNLLHCHNQ